MTTKEALAPAEESQMSPAPAHRTLVPPVDVFENDEHYLILADLPGVQPEGLKVELNAPNLSLHAEVGNDKGEDEGVKAAYERAFQVPETLDSEGVEAKLTGGVLRITLKKSEGARRRQIAIQAG